MGVMTAIAGMTATAEMTVIVGMIKMTVNAVMTTNAEIANAETTVNAGMIKTTEMTAGMTKMLVSKCLTRIFQCYPYIMGNVRLKLSNNRKHLTILTHLLHFVLFFSVWLSVFGVLIDSYHYTTSV